MKAMQNPIVAGGLAAVALGVVAWTVVQPMMRRPAASPGAKPVVATKDAAPPASANRRSKAASPPETAPIPQTPMEAEVIRTRLAEWIDAPRRDPFEVYLPVQQGPAGPRAADVLALTAIWRQTGGQWAVINNLVLTEGEQISGFKLERIEGDVVWVSGTNGTERVEFTAPGTAKPAARDAAVGKRPGGSPAQRKAST